MSLDLKMRDQNHMPGGMAVAAIIGGGFGASSQYPSATVCGLPDLRPMVVMEWGERLHDAAPSERETLLYNRLRA
jgi:hypothetical protein